jgi:regulator of sigma E protease
MSYLLAFCVISFIITLHELGHLLAAKWMGIPVARFSVGFGRKLWSFKRGETEYWFSMIPCGGYVLPASTDEETFAQLPLRSRIVFALGGPVANVLGAFLGLALMNAVQLGFSVQSVLFLPLEQVGRITIQIATVIPTLLSHPSHLSSIVGIVAAGGDQVGLDFAKFLQFSIILNLNLAILNMLPILPLDGGKIAMCLLRAIYQPLRKLEIPLTVGGWVVLLGLTLYATIHDIARIAHNVLG